MVNFTGLLTRIGDKTGTLGAVMSAMGCAFCFPAMAALGSALGLGFLSQWEPLLLDLLPVFAWLTLAINALGWFRHKHWHRSLLGMLGPIVLLLSFYLLAGTEWRIYGVYTALAMMTSISIWDLFWPTNKRCRDNACQVSTEGKQ